MKRFNLHLLTIAVIAVTFLGNCGASKSALSSGSSFMKALAGNPNLSKMTSLLQSPELGKLLGGSMKNPFTLLAPTNSALDAMGTDAITSLMKPENVGQLANLLKNHIVPGKLDAASLMKGGVSAAGGNPLDLSGVNLGTATGGKGFNIIPIDKVLK